MKNKVALLSILLLATVGVCEATNPMPMPDYDEICRIDCGGPGVTFGGFLWVVGIVAFFVLGYFVIEWDRKRPTKKNPDNEPSTHSQVVSARSNYGSKDNYEARMKSGFYGRHVPQYKKSREADYDETK